jgi:hypothetical protein
LRGAYMYVATCIAPGKVWAQMVHGDRYSSQNAHENIFIILYAAARSPALCLLKKGGWYPNSPVPVS